MLISEKINSDIYFHILEHLDEILVISNSNDDLKNNIKIFTYYYLLENDIIYFTEGFSDILDTIKVTFWSVTTSVWSGKISIYNWIGGITSALIVDRKFDLSANLILQIIKKIIPALRLNQDLSNVANIQLTKVISLGLFPTVVVGLVLYKLIKYNDVLLIKNFETALTAVIDTLRLSNGSDFLKEFNNLNNKYNEILSHNCIHINDNKLKLKCASKYYIKFITEDIITKFIYEYINYSYKNNVDISYIITFYDLCTLNININNILSKRLMLFYNLYIKILDTYVFDLTLKNRYISLLDNFTINSIKKVYIK